MSTAEVASVGRTNIVIDDELIARAIDATGARSKREAVEIALRRLVSQEEVMRALRGMRGQLAWSGNIDEWRRDRT